MKKIAILSGTLARGGAERVSLYLADKLRDFGVETVLVTMNVAPNEYSVPNGVRRVNVTEQKTYSVLGLRRVLKKEKPDLFLIMGSSNATYAIPASLGIRSKIIVSERNSPANFKGRKVTMIISRQLMKLADGFVFQTEDAKSFYSKLLEGRGVVIPNPLFVEGMPDPYIGTRERRIVTAGRLVDQKNQKLLIEAFAIIATDYPDFILDIYGEGPNRSILQNLIISKNLQERVFLKGNVPDILERIKKAFCFVMSSDFEGMPNALIESMAMGLPCISTDCPCGGPKTLIDDGLNGMLFKVGNLDDLVDRLRLLLSNETMASEMGSNAVKVREKLDAGKVVNDWHDYFMKILN